MSKTIDFYQVLGVDHKASPTELKNKYKKLVIKYHPDKNPENSTLMFELIQTAWDTLSKPDKRKEYDKMFKLQKETKTDHQSLKLGFDKFTDLASKDYKKPTKMSEQEFKKMWSDMDSKHGYDSSNKDTAICEKDLKKRFADKEQEREQQEIEYAQEKVFDNTVPLPLGKFNKMFDDYKQTEDMLVGNIIQYKGGPSPFNNMGSQFTELESCDDLYAQEFNGNSMCSSVNMGNEMSHAKIDPRKLSSADYTTNFDYKDPNYQKELEKRMQERNLETTQLGQLKLNEFNNTPNDSYIFTHEFNTNLLIGDDSNSYSDMNNSCAQLLALESNR